MPNQKKMLTAMSTQPTKIYHEIFSVPIYSLATGKIRNKVLAFPPFQREYVWGKGEEEGIVASAIANYPIDPITVCLNPSKEDESELWVTNGRQKLTALLKFMEALECDKHGEPIPKDERGHYYYYERMSSQQEAAFLNRDLTIDFVHNITVKEMMDSFKKCQLGRQLSPSQTMFASQSCFHTLTEQVSSHRYFTEMYRVSAYRRLLKEAFRSATYAGIIEAQGFTRMAKRELDTYVEGHYDEKFPDGIQQRIEHNLDDIVRLFEGVQVGSVTPMIFFYMSIYLLRRIEGVHLDGTPNGALTPWFTQARNKSSKKFLNTMGSLVNQKDLMVNFAQWLPELIDLPLLDIGETPEQRASTKLQALRLAAWIDREGICLYCPNRLVPIDYYNNHVFRTDDIGHGCSSNPATPIQFFVPSSLRKGKKTAITI